MLFHGNTMLLPELQLMIKSRKVIYLTHDNTKKCTKCQKNLHVNEFYKSKESKDGLRYQCKKCHISNEANKNPEKRHATYVKCYIKSKKEKPEHYLWKYAKARSIKNKKEFEIEVSDIVIPKECPIFKKSLSLFDEDWAPSIDRIDSSKGYVKGNVQVISRIANRMKSNATKEQLIAFAKGVLEMSSKEERPTC